MINLFCHEVQTKIRALLLVACVLFAGVAMGQQATMVLPNNGTHSNKSGPQGALRYQRGFYLVTPAEMSSTGITSGMDINSIGFTLSRAQRDTTKGQFKLFLQNTPDLVSRADTGWNTVNVSTNEYNATGLFPGHYEWQVSANCSGSSAFTSSVFFSNDELSGCNNPYNLEAVSVLTNSATLTWEAASSPVFGQYRVEYTALDAINWISATTVNTNYNITGLTAGKAYQWRVKTLCSADSSAVNYGTFTTAITTSCNTVSGLSSAVTHDSLVALAWTADASASFYEIQFRRAGTISWSNAISFTNVSNLILPAGTSYEWQVRINCGSGAKGPFTAGTFTTGGTTVCYQPVGPTTKQITATSARLTWAAVTGATGYTIRYRLKNTISWVNAVTPMTLTCDSMITIPDTTGGYTIPFEGGSAFTYTGGGVYVAWEYSRPAGSITTPNLTLSTTRGTSIAGANGQDSVTYLLSMISRADSSLAALPSIMGETRERPETRFGSTGLKDSVAVVAVYTLGMTAPKFQSPTPVSALIENSSSTNKNYAVTLTVKEQQSGAVRYTTTQNISVTATDTALITFNGWSPSILEKDSIIISVPAEAGENVLNNNSKAYFQNVNASLLAYDDGTPLVAAAGFGTAAGLLLNKHTMNGCGQVIAAKVYLTESAEGNPLYAVIRNAAGTIVAQSAAFTAARTDVNSYHTFHFTTPASFLNEAFYIGIAQSASATAYYPVGAQWEDAQARIDAYYHADLDGTNLTDHPEGGRLMIRAEIVSSAPEVSINGNLVLCTGGSNTLTAGSVSRRFANSVTGYSSQYAGSDYSAAQALGAPDVYPVHAISPASWVSATAGDQREYLELGFANPGKINFVDIYETANPGAVDSVFVKDPSTLNYVLVYSATAAAAPLTARKKHITFTETTFDVSEIRIAVNSPAVAGYNAIDAVSIGKETVPGTFSSYLWSPGGETTATKAVTAAGIYSLTVTNAGGCTSTASVTVVNAATTAPVITAGGPTAFCPGGSVVLTSNKTTGITWSNGAATPSITVSAAGSYTVTYDDGSACGALTSAAITVSINPIPTPTITGNLEICLGNENTLDAGAGYTSYLWSTGETSQTILISSAGNYSVTVTNSSGCTATSSVTASYAVLPSPVISGNLSFCPGGSTVLDAGAGYSSYLWSNGATTQTITVSSAGGFDVRVTNAGGCSASALVLTSLYITPVPVISGTAGFCTGGSTTLTAASGYTGYLWSTGSTAPSVTVSSAGTYSVSVVDNNGCTVSNAVSAMVFPTPVPAISGTLSFCGGTSTTLNAGSGYSSYVWSTGATTQTISVSTVNTFSVTVVNNFGCIASASATTTSTGALPVSPGIISGSSNVICSSSGNVYSIAPVANTSHYVWTVPAGATIASGQGTTSITVNFTSAFSGGDIYVAASNACGQSPSITARKKYVQSLANAPGNISGQATGLCGPVTKTYSISAVPLALGYTWSVPAGTSIVSGQGTTSLTVSFPGGFSFGNVCVAANNACGSGPSSCIVVSGRPPVPGAISGNATACSSDDGLLYSVDPVPGATSYTWTVPQASHITSGQGTNSILVDMGPQSGNITVVAKGSCGSSTPQVKAVVISNCNGGSANFTAAPSLIPQLKPVPEVISSYGGFATTDKMKIEWTLGEPRVENIANGEILYTQGFHQPLVYLPAKQTSIVVADNINIIVYPNPVNTLFTVELKTTEDRTVILEILDIRSRMLQRKQVKADLQTIDMKMTGYANGTYYLVVKETSGKIIKTIKIIKAEY